MSDVEITCTPANGILRIPPETIAALDLLGLTLGPDDTWRIDVTLANDVRLRARAAIPDNDPKEAAA